MCEGCNQASKLLWVTVCPDADEKFILCQSPGLLPVIADLKLTAEEGPVVQLLEAQISC